MAMRPRSPSTRTVAPSLMIWVASGQATAGMEKSRAVMAPWESTPPRSTTRPLMVVKSAVQLGSVEGADEDAVIAEVFGFSGAANDAGGAGEDAGGEEKSGEFAWWRRFHGGRPSLSISAESMTSGVVEAARADCQRILRLAISLVSGAGSGFKLVEFIEVEEDDIVAEVPAAAEFEGWRLRMSS